MMKNISISISTTVVLIIVSLLLGFFVNCSFEKQAKNESAQQDNKSELIADNSSCYVCHLNYEGEELTLDHELAGIGCSQCHGPSYAHCDDESNVTPPDIMYPKEKINPYCITCHSKDDIIHISKHQNIFRQDVTPKATCTTCHGNHRLPFRTVRWDKVTGQLLSNDGIP